MNPFSFLSPKQYQDMLKMQQFTKKIRYVVHTDGASNSLEVKLESDDPEAAQLIPQILEGLLKSTANGLYQMFGMEGKRV